MGLQMMSSSGEDMAPPPLDASSTSILTQWVALVMLTLEELGVPQDLLEARMQGVATASLDCGDSPDPRVSKKSPYLQGMLSYVQQTLGMHESGTTLAMMSGLQDLVRSADTPPTVLLMQQYTRLVLLTVEVVAMLQLPCKRPFGQPSVVQTATDYILGFQVCAPPLPLQAASASSPPAPSGSTEKETVMAAARQPAVSTSSRSSSSQQVSIMAAMETDSLDDDPEPAQAQSPTTGGAASSSSSGLYALPDEHLEDERSGGGGDMNGQGLVACPPARGVAVRMLVAFMAAVQTGSQWALNDFVTSTQYAYLQV